MPMFRSTAATPNERAMSGNAVVITVASRFSMKNVTATSRAIRVERFCGMNIFPKRLRRNSTANASPLLGLLRTRSAAPPPALGQTIQRQGRRLDEDHAQDLHR